MDEESVLAHLRADPERLHTLPEIAKRLDLAPEKTKSLRRILKGLVKRGELERERGHAFRVSRAGQETLGRVAFDDEGVAHFASDDPKARWIRFVPDEQARVEENDRVKVELVAVGGRRGRLQARIVEVLDRPPGEALGLFRHIGKVIFVEIEPPREGGKRVRRGARAPLEVLVLPEDTGGAQDGQLVKVDVLRKGRGSTQSTTAKVVEVLGKPGLRETEFKRLMLEHHLDAHFPKQADEEAERYGQAPSEKDIAGRRDLRDLPLVTIDGETAKDFDDAVCAVKHGRDGYKLYVAIADVAHYVRPGSALDKEAVTRGTSTYLTDRAIPMLPEALSNRLCSLMPKVDRLCMVAELTLDRSGHVEQTSFYDAVMRSQARLTYTRVAKALEGEPDEECARLLPTILMLAKVAAILLERRLKRGAIDLDLSEPVVIFDENNFPIDIQKRDRNDAHRLIEDLMLAANEAVASYFVDRNLPTMFRIHEDPDPEKLQIFAALCATLGIHAKLKKNPKPRDVAQLLQLLSEHPIGKSLNPLLLRSLMQARYDIECKGHFGLAADRYLHFTSPIRRYPDLMTHRLLKRALSSEDAGYSKETLAQIAQQASEAERRAMLAERESMDLDRAYVALEHLGETFKATITGVQAFGVFAAVDAPYIEGMIPIALLGNDYFELDEFGSALTGSTSGQRFSIGQQVEIDVVAASIPRRQVEFRLTGVVVRSSDNDDRPRRDNGRPDRDVRRSPKPGGAKLGGSKPPKGRGAKGKGARNGGKSRSSKKRR